MLMPWQIWAPPEPFPITFHLHLPASVHPANHFLSRFYVATCLHVHSCTCVDVHSTWYQYCAVRWLHVFCDVYIYSFHHLPSLPPFSHKNPSPVPSVPTGSKGGVSSASLQRSRSDVDVNAAAVAKHRHVGQTRPAGHLPPGSYSSLGKSPLSQVGWLIRRCKNNNSRQNEFKVCIYESMDLHTDTLQTGTGLSPLLSSPPCFLPVHVLLMCFCINVLSVHVPVIESRPPCFVSLLRGCSCAVLWYRCDVTNTPCVPLFSCLLSPFLHLYSLSFISTSCLESFSFLCLLFSICVSCLSSLCL